VLYVPRNILSDDAAAAAQAGEIGVAAVAAAPGLEQKSQGGDVLIKLRLSTGEVRSSPYLSRRLLVFVTCMNYYCYVRVRVPQPRAAACYV